MLTNYFDQVLYARSIYFVVTKISNKDHIVQFIDLKKEINIQDNHTYFSLLVTETTKS